MFWISLKYISNISIIGCLFAYYTNAIYLYISLIPLIITNCIIILILLMNETDRYELMKKLYNESDKEVLNKKSNEFIIINVIYHLIPIFWIYHIHIKDNLIILINPNSIEIFIHLSFACIIYFIISSSKKFYGDINYLKYCILYWIILLFVCILIFPYKY